MNQTETEALGRRLLALVDGGPDGEGARARLHHYLAAAGDALLECVPDENAEQLLGLFLGQSPSLSRSLTSEPPRLAQLARDPFLRREKPEALFQKERAQAVLEAGDAMRGLRRFRNREYLRLGARELGYGTGEEVGRELAALASACIDGAVDAATDELNALYGPPLTDGDADAGASRDVDSGARQRRASDGGAVGGVPKRCRFVVLGMGKLGGQELNFSSDIDLIYLYESDLGAAGQVTLHQYFSRLAERITELLGAATTDGSCFRVDLRLRPEGTQGPIVNSLPAVERYYESFGRPWERQALLKARPVGGDRALGEEALRMLEPFVWPRLGGGEVIASIRALMSKAQSRLGRVDDIKLGTGGIREVEFFVQALQLVHGGRRRELRERSTLRALDKLLFGGLMSERERRALGDAYVFLRRVEHRVQLEELLQTHALPTGKGDRALLGRRLGLEADAFEARLGEHRRQVSAIYQTLGRPPEGPPVEVTALLDPTSDRAMIEAALLSLGFRDVESSADEMEQLRRRPRSPFGPSATGSAATAAMRLLEEASVSPDPDLALRRLVDLVLRGASGDAVCSLVAAVPPIGRLLANLFGTSDFLSRIFVAHPELVEPLLVGDGRRGSRTRADHSAALDERIAADADESARLSTDGSNGRGDKLDGDSDGGRVESGSGSDEDREERLLDLVRRYRNEELLRIGLRDVSGELEVDEVCADLSALAEACLATTLDIVSPGVFRRWGRPRTSLAVLALGKLGAAELTYSSDLDLVFVFGDEDAPVDPYFRPYLPPFVPVPVAEHGAEVAGDAREGRRASSAFEVMSRLVQRLISGLHAQLPSGRLYEVDTRLRPSGMQGALVSSLAGFARYHQGSAALWERQALIKARTVAGDAELGASVEAIAARHVWEGPSLLPAQAALEIGRLRARMERELARETPGRFDIKSGRGGLLDVEFLVQYLQLIHGPRLPAVRARATRPALDALLAAGVLDRVEHDELGTGYRFLRRLENRMRIVHDRPISQMESGRDEARLELGKLARRLGYHGAMAGARLLAEYRARTARLRALYARYLPAPETP